MTGIHALGSSPWAQAFKLGRHEQIVREALEPFGIAPDRTDLVVGTFLSGRGNLGSDLHQMDTFRHFDNARTPQEVCERATDAWNHFYPQIRDSLRPGNQPNGKVIDERAVADAMSAFGGLTHAVEDFYAHSNWAELHVALGQPPTIAPGLFPTPCDFQSWPAGVQTGYFSLSDGIDGCPESTPPAGYTYCHEALNKDNAESIRGGAGVPGMPGTTYHQLVAQLATTHTSVLYQDVAAALEQDWKVTFPDQRPDCLRANLFQGTGDACDPR